MTEKEQYVSVSLALDDLPELEAGEIDETDKSHQVCNHRPSTVQKYRESEPGDTPHGGYSPRVLYENKPSWTVVVGNGKTPIHYDEPRMLTPRELLRLQTFPDWFVLTPDSRGKQCRLAGNAVPVDLAESVIGELS